MFKLIGVLIIITALLIAGRWVSGDRAHKGWVFAVCLAALFAGSVLIFQDRATEITVDLTP